MSAVADRRTPLRRGLRWLLKATLRFAARIYFRRLITVGEPAADTAGRLFAANHFNGIVDPLLILARARYDASPIAKSTLFKIPVLRSVLGVAEAVPVTRRKDAPDKSAADNEKVFEHVAGHLRDGGNILIFPEGVSHDEPHVLPLKTGAARMLVLARKEGAKGLTMQAVALDFDARERFRSRALVTYGPVHAVDEVAAAVADDNALVHALMELIAGDLARLVVQGESQGELFLARRVAELLSNQAQTGTFANQIEIAREVVQKAHALGADDPRYRAVVESVSAYSVALSIAGLSDRQIAHGRSLTLPRLLHGLWLTLLLPFSILGAVLFFVPYRLPRLASRLAHGEIDVLSTYKLGIGMVAFPTWLVLLLVATCQMTASPLARLLAMALVPICAYAALIWVDRLDDRRGSRLAHQASRSGQTQLAALAELRARALAAIDAARARADGSD